MAQAIVDPVELRRFAGELEKFAQSLKASMSTTQGRLSSLGSTWRDQEFTKFNTTFQSTSKTLTPFITEMEEYSKYLKGKAGRVEDYQGYHG